MVCLDRDKARFTDKMCLDKDKARFTVKMCQTEIKQMYRESAVFKRVKKVL